MAIALEARDLVKKYPGVIAVDGLSFSVREGICFGLLGPNGAGKTTTVEIIEGVTRPTSGEVYYYGEIAGARFREEAGIQFQNTALQDYLTVRETIEMFRSLYDRQANITTSSSNALSPICWIAIIANSLVGNDNACCSPSHSLIVRG